MHGLADEKQKTEVIIAFGANFGKEFSGELLSLWLDMLTEYSVQQVRQAARKVLETYEFKTLPPFAVLKKALDGVSGNDEESLKTQAEAEWGVLQGEVSRVGSYGKPRFHPTTAYTVRQMGGWEAACLWPIESLGFKRRDFVEIWLRSHGKTESMQLGANATREAIAAGPRHIGDALRAIPSRGVHP